MAEQPVAHERPDDAHHHVAKQAEAVALDDDAGEPAGDGADEQEDDERFKGHGDLQVWVASERVAAPGQRGGRDRVPWPPRDRAAQVRRSCLSSWPRIMCATSRDPMRIYAKQARATLRRRGVPRPKFCFSLASNRQPRERGAVTMVPL